jgi:hypothetical protein
MTVKSVNMAVVWDIQPCGTLYIDRYGRPSVNLDETSGVSRFFKSGANSYIGRPWQKLRTLKKLQLFIEFYCISLDKLRYFERRKSIFFSFNILILPPLGLCCPGRPHHSPHSIYAPVWEQTVHIPQGTIIYIHLLENLKAQSTTCFQISWFPLCHVCGREVLDGFCKQPTTSSVYVTII